MFPKLILTNNGAWFIEDFCSLIQACHLQHLDFTLFKKLLIIHGHKDFSYPNAEKDDGDGLNITHGLGTSFWGLVKRKGLHSLASFSLLYSQLTTFTRLDRKPYNTCGALNSSLPLIDITTKRDSFPRYLIEACHLGLFWLGNLISFKYFEINHCQKFISTRWPEQKGPFLSFQFRFHIV